MEKTMAEYEVGMQVQLIPLELAESVDDDDIEQNNLREVFGNVVTISKIEGSSTFRCEECPDFQLIVKDIECISSKMDMPAVSEEDLFGVV